MSQSFLPCFHDSTRGRHSGGGGGKIFCGSNMCTLFRVRVRACNVLVGGGLCDTVGMCMECSGSKYEVRAFRSPGGVGAKEGRTAVRLERFFSCF